MAHVAPTEAASATTPDASPAGGLGRYRWVICALLFSATAFNYVDRQMIGVLKPTIQAELGWSETSYSGIVVWFQLAYGLGYLFFGRIVDAMGARFGYAIAFLIWTAAHMLHGAARSTLQFSLVRALLGIGESGNFPSGLKAVSEWFPAKERALATGIFNAGSNIGAIITPIVVPYIVVTLALGWRAAFVITGAVSFVWLFAWIWIYRRPREQPRLSAGELAYIERDPADIGDKIAWTKLLGYRETWAFALGKFLTDPIWWLFLFWLPDFLSKRYHLDLVHFGPPLVVVYVISDLGSVAGGWCSSRLMHGGMSANAARKLTMLGCSILVTPIFFAQYVDSLWGSVAIIGLATAAHQAFSANIYTLPSDMFPRNAVGSVIGIGGTAGALGGALMSVYTGKVLELTGSYTLIFAVAGSVYLLAMLVIQLLVPTVRRVDLLG